MKRSTKPYITVENSFRNCDKWYFDISFRNTKQKLIFPGNESCSFPHYGNETAQLASSSSTSLSFIINGTFTFWFLGEIYKHLFPRILPHNAEIFLTREIYFQRIYEQRSFRRKLQKGFKELFNSLQNPHSYFPLVHPFHSS